MKKISFLFLLFACFTQAAYAESTLEVLEKIPVQHGGRIKPFQSFAQEATLTVTGKKRYKGMDPTQLVWSWMAEPDLWNNKPFLNASYQPLQKELGLAVIEGKVSPEIVLGDQKFLEKVQDALRRNELKEKLSELDRKRIELYQDTLFFREIATGRSPAWIANPNDPTVAWLALQAFSTPQGVEMLQNNFPQEATRRVIDSLKGVLDAFRSDWQSPETAVRAREFSDALGDLFATRAILLDQKVLDQEITYNRLQPFGLAAKAYGISILLWVVVLFLNRVKFSWLLGMVPFALGFIMHTYGFYLRCMIAGRPPVTNMYESIVWVSWAVAFFAFILFAVYRSHAIPLAASIVAALSLAIAQGFPVLLNPSVSPLVPVLRSNFWLSIHVLTITLSYGAFALAWGLGHAVVFGYAFSKNRQAHQNLAQFLYRSIQIGVILLASGTVLGGVWANYSWGRFWGWDPKETWALIALLGYLAVLHGRFAGWFGTFGLAMGSVAAFLGIVMAWYGVNFVLAAGLHSYGFGGGGAPYVLGVALLDLFLISCAAWVYQKKRKALQTQDVK